MTRSTPSPDRDVLVVGAGFAGLYALHSALRAGLDTVCLEAASGVGGTWHFNRYPGARCDVESVDYSYSFDEELQKEWRWTERYATQPEILAYINHVADRFDLRRHIRLNTRVGSARFDEQRSLWRVRTERGEEYRARYLFLATGALSAPHLPDIPGRDDFAGQVLLTAQWPEEPPSLAGKRVGVIGTGSSGIQLVPIVAREAASLTVFQRTANYSVPVLNRALDDEEWERVLRDYPERRRKSRHSGGGSPHESHPRRAVELDEAERTAALEARWNEGGVLFGKTFPDQTTDPVANDYARRFAEAKIRELVDDPRTAEDLIPRDHPIGTKRICTDSGYYQTFNRDNVTLVNLRRTPITRITAHGVRTSNATHELDTLVFATGFDALTGALTRIDIRGAGGGRLADAWQRGPLTYLGMGVPGFPNMFCINGPGSPAVLANMVLTAEQQVDWIMDLVRTCRREGFTQVDVRDDAAHKWTDHVGQVADATLFPRADSWYTGANIEGKPRGFMLYLGGLGGYRRICDGVADGGYEGFVMSAR